jgi:hypothetical protein
MLPQHSAGINAHRPKNGAPAPLCASDISADGASVPLLGHQLRSAPCQGLPVQATGRCAGVFNHQLQRCAYVSTEGGRRGGATEQGAS